MCFPCCIRSIRNLICRVCARVCVCVGVRVVGKENKNENTYELEFNKNWAWLVLNYCNANCEIILGNTIESSGRRESSRIVWNHVLPYLLEFWSTVCAFHDRKSATAFLEVKQRNGKLISQVLHYIKLPSPRESALNGDLHMPNRSEFYDAKWQ